MLFVDYFLNVDIVLNSLFTLFNIICKKFIPIILSINPILCMMKLPKTPQYGNGEAGRTVISVTHDWFGWWCVRSLFFRISGCPGMRRSHQSDTEKAQAVVSAFPFRLEHKVMPFTVFYLISMSYAALLLGVELRHNWIFLKG